MGANGPDGGAGGKQLVSNALTATKADGSAGTASDFDVNKSYITTSNSNGSAGSKGGDSVAAANMGNLYCASTLTILAAGGKAGSGGAKGESSDYTYVSSYMGQTIIYEIGSAGGGGGGGGGYAGANIGTGGKSGAGGGGGGGGSYAPVGGTTYIPVPLDEKIYGNGGGGTGGFGGNSGTTGGGTKTTTAVDNFSGGAGGASGAAGAAGTENTSYDKNAVLSYNITYNMVDGTTSMDSYNVGKASSASLLEDPGCRWQLTTYGKSCSATDSEFAQENSALYESGSKITLADVYGDIAFTAVPNTYTVTLNANGGGCSELTSYTYGVGATLPTPTKAGYNFAGWYDNEEFEGEPVTAVTTTDTGNKEYFAKWEIDAVIEESENTLEFPSVQSKITGNKATMRFMWQINFADGAKIDNIGAYIIPWGMFDGTMTGKGSIVQYDNPQIQNGDTFSADLTDIPKMASGHNIFEEMEISAFPFINGKLLGNFITSTVDEANIDK